jgi:hypothetical protein
MDEQLEVAVDFLTWPDISTYLFAPYTLFGQYYIMIHWVLYDLYTCPSCKGIFTIKQSVSM